MPGLARQHLGGGHQMPLGTLAFTPVAFRDQRLAAGAALLPVFDAQRPSYFCAPRPRPLPLRLPL